MEVPKLGWDLDNCKDKELANFHRIACEAMLNLNGDETCMVNSDTVLRAINYLNTMIDIVHVGSDCDCGEYQKLIRFQTNKEILLRGSQCCGAGYDNLRKCDIIEMVGGSLIDEIIAFGEKGLRQQANFDKCLFIAVVHAFVDVLFTEDLMIEINTYGCLPTAKSPGDKLAVKSTVASPVIVLLQRLQEDVLTLREGQTRMEDVLGLIVRRLDLLQLPSGPERPEE